MATFTVCLDQAIT